jgi:hypothetical protein
MNKIITIALLLNFSSGINIRFIDFKDEDDEILNKVVE